LYAAIGSYSGVASRESEDSAGLAAMGAGKKLNSGTSKGSGDWGEPQEPTEEEGDAMIEGAEEGEKHCCYRLEEEGE
jgi:hypothetical protein